MKYDQKEKEIPGIPGTTLSRIKQTYSEQERQEILDRLTTDGDQDDEDDDFVSQEELL
jgi:hypothetical protein